MKYLNSEIETCHNEYHRLLTKWDEAICDAEQKTNIFNRAKFIKAKETAEKAYTDYYLNVYAKAVFRAYSNIKPNLIRVRTGDIYAWNDLFKPKFEDVDIRCRNILVGLIEGNGSYRFS